MNKVHYSSKIAKEGLLRHFIRMHTKVLVLTSIWSILEPCLHKAEHLSYSYITLTNNITDYR